jgi:hypothetical protein
MWRPIPFFAALHQAFKVVDMPGKNKVFSPAAVKALRTIKYCAMAIIGFVAVGEIFIMLGNSDDRAGESSWGSSSPSVR